MQIAMLEETWVDPQMLSLGAHPRERRTGRFLHHIAKLPGQHKPLAARHSCRLDEDNIAAHRRPDQTGDNARPVDPLGYLGEIALLAEVGSGLVGIHHDGSWELGVGGWRRYPQPPTPNSQP